MKGSPQQVYLHCEVVQNQPADDEVQISMVLYTHGEFTTTFLATMFLKAFLYWSTSQSTHISVDYLAIQWLYGSNYIDMHIPGLLGTKEAKDQSFGAVSVDMTLLTISTIGLRSTSGRDLIPQH